MLHLRSFSAPPMADTIEERKSPAVSALVIGRDVRDGSLIYCSFCKQKISKEAVR
jgi:hypothetical protein